jgi:hypothetical protein
MLCLRDWLKCLVRGIRSEIVTSQTDFLRYLSSLNLYLTFLEVPKNHAADFAFAFAVARAILLPENYRANRL